MSRFSLQRSFAPVPGAHRAPPGRAQSIVLFQQLLTHATTGMVTSFARYLKLVPAIVLVFCSVAEAADPPTPSPTDPPDPAPEATDAAESPPLRISDAVPVSQLDETIVNSSPIEYPVAERPAVSQLDEVVSTLSPTESSLFEQPRSMYVLEGEELEHQLQPTLGETLSNTPGVRSSYFGPVASRPVIRGLAGDRIRILQNGVNTIDASGTSVDHAVSIQPMGAKRIEIVRGPATLLYGSNAIGGVVNIQDNRIPDERIESLLRGSARASYSSVNEGVDRHFLFEGGAEGFNYHVELFRQEAQNLHIPGFARSDRLRAMSPLAPGETEARGVLPNSYASTEGMSLGSSYVGDDGYFGFAYRGFDSNYGSPAEDVVSIDMKQRRWDFRGALYEPFQGVKEIEFKLGVSNYMHTEFEGNVVGTTFRNEGYDGRIDLRHEKVGGFEGTVGYQTERSDFSALGEEAFVPTVLTLSNSVFVFEEADLATGWKFQMGARYDHITADSAASPKFGPARSRAFDNVSGSMGVVFLPNDDYAVSLSSSWSERAPTYQELFANGPHVATRIIEVGDSNLPVEQALGFELALRKRTGFVTGSITPYYNRFNNYIGQFRTGGTRLLDGEPLPVTVYRSTDAEFYGGEIETTFHLLGPVETPDPADAGGVDLLDLELKADYVRATDTVSGDPLPRISPFHASAALNHHRGDFGSRLECVYSSRQNRTAANELPTNAYFLLNASVHYTFRTAGRTSANVYLKGVNLTNEEARVHTSFLKDLAPLPGRGVAVGMKVEF